MKFIFSGLVSILTLISCDLNPSPSITIEELELNLDNAAVFPYLCSDGDDLLMSWIETENDTLDVLKLGFLKEGKLEDITRVAEGSDWFVNWADFPEVALFSSGKYITHWLQKSSGSTYDYDIRVAIGYPGMPPDTTFILHDDGVHAEHGFASFAPYGDEMMAVWLDGRDMKKEDGSHGQMTLRSAILNDRGEKRLDTVIDSRVCDCCQTDLAIVEERAMVVYRDRSDREVRDNYYAVFDGKEWSEGEPLADEEWVIAGCPVNGPAIDAHNDRIAATWYTEAVRPEVKLVFYGQNQFSSPVFTIAEDNTSGRVDVMMLSAEEAVVSWMEKDGSIIIQKWNKQGPGSQPITVGQTNPGRASGFPKLSLSGNKLYIAYTGPETTAGIVIKRIEIDRI